MPFWPDPQLAAWSALLLTAPLFIWAAVCDLRAMLIPNWISIALALIFAIWAVLFVTPEDAAWRVFAGVVTLVVGIALVIFARMGGGDMKLMAAAAPFIAPGHLGAAMVLLSVCLLALLPCLAIARRVVRARAAPVQWVSLQPEMRQVPMGVSIAAAAVVYLALNLPVG
jgi:prepilin peptidase CpaA